MASQLPRRSVAIAALFLVAGCSASTEQASDSDLKTKLRLTRPDWAQSQKPAPDTIKALRAEDFVGADGRCAGDAVPPVEQPAPGALYFQAGPEAGPPPARAGSGPAQPGSPLARGVGLDISECDLVRTLGHTDQVEITTNDRGERNVVITYLQGERPGIYRFVSGRLKSMERAPEPPAADKPAAPKKPGKKPASS